MRLSLFILISYSDKKQIFHLINEYEFQNQNTLLECCFFLYCAKKILISIQNNPICRSHRILMNKLFFCQHWLAIFGI